jgi:hypothetical protein
VEYNGPVIKVDQLAASVLLILGSVGFISDPVGQRWILHIPPASGKQGPAALTNKKQEKNDQLCADNIINKSGFRIYRQEIFFLNAFY